MADPIRAGLAAWRRLGRGGAADSVRPPGAVGARTDDLYGALATYSAGGAALASQGDLTRFERRLFSQNGEDGVVAEVLRRVGVGERWFVEFGAGTGHEGVCVALADVLGWSGLFMDADPTYVPELHRKYAGMPRVRTARAFITAENVEERFAAGEVPPEPDVVSIDVDGNDWWIWRALVAYRPRLVVIEYNGNLDVASLLVKPYDPAAEWDQTAWFGASLGAYEWLAATKGYTLVHTDLRGVNAFFLRDDLLPAFGPVAPPRRAANYDLLGTHLFADPRERPWVDLVVDPVAAGDPLG